MNSTLNVGANTGPDGGGSSIESLTCKSSVLSSTGFFTFEVEGFTNLSDEVGDTVESPEFELCGRTWQLRVFPGGSLAAHRGYLSYYLASKSTVVTRASYKLIIVRQHLNTEDTPENLNVTRTDEVFASTGVRKFEARGVHVDGWGRDKFISNSALREPANGLIVNNKVIFRVEITVFGDLDIPNNSKLVIQRSEHKLKNDFERLLFDSNTTDLTLIVGDDEDQPEYILAHRSILCARSPIFYAMLQSREDHHEMKCIEAWENAVRIRDVEPEVMKTLLIYIYTDQCSQAALSKDADKIMGAAVKYQVLGLVHATEEFLATVLSVSNCCDMYSLADLYSATNLKTFVGDFIGEHASHVIDSEAFKTLRQSLREEVVELCSKSQKNCCKRRGPLDRANWCHVM